MRLFAVAAIAVSFVSTAQAQEHTFTNYHHYLLGQWRCSGQVNTPDGKQFDTVGAWKVKRVGHGHVYDKFENYTGDGFRYVARGMTHYDKLAGVLNRHVVSSMNTWTRYVSHGWQDSDTLTWDGESHRFGHPPLHIKQVIKKQDADTLELRVRVKGAGHKDNDGWDDMYKGTCTRQGGHAGGHDDDGKTPSGKQDSHEDVEADDDEENSDAMW